VSSCIFLKPRWERKKNSPPSPRALHGDWEALLEQAERSQSMRKNTKSLGKSMLVILSYSLYNKHFVTALGDLIPKYGGEEKT